MNQKTFPAFVTIDLLQDWNDFAKSEANVGASLVDLGPGNNAWMHFLVAYSGWKSRFPNGVAALASFIDEQRNLFKEADVPAIVADRSNYIASFIFDEARDECNDHIQTQRRMPRGLGQATIMGAAEFYGIDLNNLFEPQWLHSFRNTVLAGYTGINILQIEPVQANPLPGELLHRIFQGIGYHLGSELLGKREFAIIDSFLRAQNSELVHHLLHYRTTFSSGQQSGYAWIDIHSAPKMYNGLEDDFVCYALQGVNKALGFIPTHLTDECMLSLRHGFLRFSHDQQHFFQRAGQVTE